VTKADDLRRPEIFVALVNGAGTDTTEVKAQLAAQFAAVGYTAEHVKLSELIADFCSVDTSEMDEAVRVRSLMDAGDDLRKATGRGEAVLSLAMAEIRSRRTDISGSDEDVASNRVFVIDSLKNPTEVRSLRHIYGGNFFLLSIYSQRSRRIDKLANRIAESRHTSLTSDIKKESEDLISIDERRDQDDLTQNVQETFPLGDYFISADKAIESDLKRFVELIFGEPFGTPRQAEYFMYCADAASMRSADLSRQVGAVLVGPGGDILATGSNEVPYPGGGFFSEGDQGKRDNRDYKREHDPNAFARTDIVREFVAAIRRSKLFGDEAKAKSDEDITQDLLYGEARENVEDARIRSLIEFGTVVHAEMHAISQAAEFGRATRKSTLYCTTFPCHVCARHIISSGISRVIYIEPYPKSLTKQMYSAEICVDGEGGTLPKAVVFEPFIGVSPRLYSKVFRHRPRKNKYGSTVQWNRLRAMPQGAGTGEAYLVIEGSKSGELPRYQEKLTLYRSNTAGEKGDPHGQEIPDASSEGSGEDE
jgi:cytidine deaminase